MYEYCCCRIVSDKKQMSAADRAAMLANSPTDIAPSRMMLLIDRSGGGNG